MSTEDELNKSFYTKEESEEYDDSIPVREGAVIEFSFNLKYYLKLLII